MERDGNLVNNYDLLPKAKHSYYINQKSGYIKKIKTSEIGRAAMIIGAGRQNKDSIIDHAVGLAINKKVGDFVNEQDIICEIKYNDLMKIYNHLLN